MLDKRLVFALLILCITPAAIIAKPMDIGILVEYTAAENPNRRQIVDGVVRQLVDRLDSDSRLSLSLYADKIHQIEPLQTVNAATGQRLMTAINDLNPDGTRMNPAASLEQTIYRLRTTGREQAEKRIVVLGDGVVDTGDALRNNELAQWIRQELSTEAARSNIRIDWLTFSESANFRTIQIVTQKTGGSYFRAYSPEEALSALDAIVIAKGSDGAKKATETGSTSPKNGSLTPWAGLWLELNGQWLVVASGLALTLMLLGGGLYLRHKHSSKTKRSVYVDDPQDPKALLCDLSQFTSLSEYDITDKRTYIGRQPREVTERSCIIIISDSSVGRNHACIDCRDKQYWIRDLDTVNGTYINGERITGNRKLHHGDKIRFARFEFALTLPRSEEIPDPLGHTYTATDTIPDDERTVFRSRQ